MLRLDLHIHSQYSEDAEGSAKDIIKSLKKKGLDGMAITDHNNIKGGIKALEVKPKDFIVIPGVEISTKDGHILALNVKEDLPRNLGIEETTEKIINLGGIPIVPHLFRTLSGIQPKNLKKIINHIQAIEVFNGCSVPQSNFKTMKIAKKYKLGGTGGSDTHQPQYAGLGYTIVDTTDYSIDTIISKINNRKTWGEGTTLPLSYRQGRMIKSIKQFFQRGLSRI